MIRRYIFILIFLVLMAIGQILTWIIISRSYIYSTDECYFDFWERIICSGVDVTSELWKEKPMPCPEIPSIAQCNKVYSVVRLLLASIIYIALPYKVLLIVALSCSYCFNINCLMCCFLLISYLIYLTITILLFAGAGILSTLIVPKIVEVNSILIGIYVTLGIINCLKLIVTYFIIKNFKVCDRGQNPQELQPQQAMIQNQEINVVHHQEYLLTNYMINEAVQFELVQQQNSHQQKREVQQQINIPEIQEVVLK